MNYAHNNQLHIVSRGAYKQTNKLQIYNIKIMFMFCSTLFDIYFGNKYTPNILCQYTQIDSIEKKNKEKRENTKKTLGEEKRKKKLNRKRAPVEILVVFFFLLNFISVAKVYYLCHCHLFLTISLTAVTTKNNNNNKYNDKRKPEIFVTLTTDKRSSREEKKTHLKHRMHKLLSLKKQTI